MKDVFEDGHVDVAIFQPTYLKSWYTGRLQHDREERRSWPRSTRASSCVNTRFEPRERRRRTEGRSSENVAPLAMPKGVKLYTAEWLDGSRGWTLKDPGGVPVSWRRAQELGIQNVHVHKGPTIWPLDKDAFDVSDVDHAATDFPDLNFIVEHVGLPRIEDFCFMATQEPNVYAGLSVVIGGLHARATRSSSPRYGRAAVLGRRGQDDASAATTAIWEPKWQVEGFVDWDYPERRVLRLSAPGRRGQEEDPGARTRPSCTTSTCPPSCRLPADAGTPARRATTPNWWSSRSERSR